MDEIQSLKQVIVDLQNRTRKLENHQITLGGKASTTSGGGNWGGYTDQDTFIEALLQISCEADTLTNMEVIEAIWGWTVSLLTSTASSGQKNVPIVDGSLFSAGQTVVIRDDNHHETATIDTISTNTLVMTANLTYSYMTAAHGKVELWTPGGFDTPDNVLRLQDKVTGNYFDMFPVLVDSGSYVAPLAIINQGVTFQKDLAVGGFVSANQGVLYLGSGFTQCNDYPAITLLHGGGAIQGDASSGQPDVTVWSDYGFHIGNFVTLRDTNHTEQHYVTAITEMAGTPNYYKLTLDENLTYSYAVSDYGRVENLDILHIKTLSGDMAKLKCATTTIIDYTPTLNLEDIFSGVALGMFGHDRSDAYLSASLGSLILYAESKIIRPFDDKEVYFGISSKRFKSITSNTVTLDDDSVPILYLKVSNVLKASLSFDGSNTSLTTNTGDLILYPNSGLVRPYTTGSNTSLGSSGAKFYNGYFSGDIHCDGLIYGTLSGGGGGTVYRADIPDFWSTPFWSNIPDKPSTFTPASHNHAASDVTSGTFDTGRIPTITYGMTNFCNQTLNLTSDAIFNSVSGTSGVAGIKTGSGSNMTAMTHDGTDGTVAALAGILYLDAVSYVCAVDAFHIKGSYPVLNLQVSSTQKGAFGFDGTNSYLVAYTGNLYLTSAAAYVTLQSTMATLNVIPVGSGNTGYGIGSGGAYYAGIVCDTLYYVTLDASPWDTHDDLALAQYATKTNDKGETVIDIDSLDFLRPDVNHENGFTSETRKKFFDSSKMFPFLLGCAKQTGQRFSDVEEKINMLKNEIDSIKTAITKSEKI
jgi:hypothetical protein